MHSMNNENNHKILLTLLRTKPAPLGNIRCILLYLIFTVIITTMPFIMTPNLDNNNNIAKALKQNNNVPTSSNINNSKAIATAAIPSSISLPLSRGYINGKLAYFIATDASDNQTAIEISNNLKFKVNFAPSLAFVPESSRQQGYEFLNGVRGQGAFGFQLPVASKLPTDKDYSPIVQLNFVKWNSDATGFNNHTSNTIKELKSVSEIITAQNNKELTIARTNILINSPAVFPAR